MFQGIVRRQTRESMVGGGFGKGAPKDPPPLNPIFSLPKCMCTCHANPHGAGASAGFVPVDAPVTAPVHARVDPHVCARVRGYLRGHGDVPVHGMHLCTSKCNGACALWCMPVHM